MRISGLRFFIIIIIISGIIYFIKHQKKFNYNNDDKTRTEFNEPDKKNVQVDDDSKYVSYNENFMKKKTATEQKD